MVLNISHDTILYAQYIVLVHETNDALFQIDTQVVYIKIHSVVTVDSSPCQPCVI